MNKTPNKNYDFVPTAKKPLTPVQPSSDNDDANNSESIDLVPPVVKSKRKHNNSHLSSSDITESDTDDFVYARPHHKRHKKKKKVVRILIIVLCVILALIIATGATLLIFREVGKSSMHNYNDMTIEPSPQIEKIEDVTNEGKTITYNGSTYSFNEKVTTVVLMGIDTKDFENPDRVVGAGGQADAIYIAVIDTAKDKVTILGVSRDAMVDVNIYNTNGEFVGTENMQLCLSYAYGDGAHTSCENTITSLERLFYGMQYDTYFSIDTRALETLTDAVDGVTVTALVDFYSDYYARTIKAGETVTIYGNDATMYIRSRDIEELDSNNDRMARQKQFMTAFLAKIWDSVKSNPAVITDLYGEIADNSTTNLTPSKMTYLATTAISSLDSYSDIEFVNVEGTITKGEYAEFNVDQDALMELMLDLFYVEVS